MPNPKKTVLLLGQNGLMTDVLQSVLCKEDWQLLRSKWTNEQWQSCVRLHNPQTIIAFVGTEFSRKTLSYVMAVLDQLILVAEKAQVQHLYLVAAPADETAQQAYVLLMAQLLAWRGHLACQLTMVHLPQLYGPAMRKMAGNIAKNMLRTARRGEQLNLEALAAQVTGEAMHEDDAAYAVRQIVARGIDAPQVTVAANNEVLRQQLGWQPRYDLRTGLQQVWPRLQAVVRARRRGRRQAAAKDARRRIWHRVIPWLENGASALVMQAVMEMQGGSFVNTFISFDLNYLYIGAFGLVYGRVQALVAMLFSSILLIHLWLGMGHDIVGLLYEPAGLLHLTSYLFVAFLTGYFADRRDQERHELRWEKNEQKEQYRELLQAYNACMDTKDALYRQIVNSDDSIGRIYNIIRRLDSVDVEQVFDQAASVTAEILNVHDIAIYIPDANGNYLRSKVRLGTLTQQLPHSLNRQQEDWLQPVLSEQRVFVNNDLLQGRPDLAAPVIYDEQIIAVVAIYGLRFEQWSLSQQNLLSVTMRLIASSLGRARQFESEAEERRYIAGTNILQAEAFKSVLQGMLQRSQRQAQADMDTGVYLLHLVRDTYTDAELDAKLASCLHAGDFVGVMNGGVAVLLAEANADTADIVARRLTAAGLHVERQEKVAA